MQREYKDQMRHAYDAACQQLEKLMEERERIEREITGVKQSIVALAPFAADGPSVFEMLRRIGEEVGMTDGCREILRANHPKGLTPVEVRDQLQRIGHDFRGSSNPLAAIHAVLKRLVDESKEAKRSTNAEGDTVYTWIRRFPRAHRRRRNAAFYGEPSVTPET